MSHEKKLALDYPSNPALLFPPMPTPPVPIKKPSSPLGRKLRRARSKAGLTQLALAHKSGYKGPDAGAHICRIEAGAQKPQLETLIRISKALGIELGELV
jgi:DNA-binding XRE family transcriptional regulator